MRLEDAGIIGAGHETMHQRCSLAINEEDLGERVEVALRSSNFMPCAQRERPVLADHETMHQRCSLAINEEDLGERGK